MYGLSVCWLSLSGSARLSVQQEKRVHGLSVCWLSLSGFVRLSVQQEKGVWPECLLAQSVRFCEAFSSAGKGCMA